jgi:hypothetical protein
MPGSLAMEVVFLRVIYGLNPITRNLIIARNSSMKLRRCRKIFANYVMT